VWFHRKVPGPGKDAVAAFARPLLFYWKTGRGKRPRQGAEDRNSPCQRTIEVVADDDLSALSRRDVHIPQRRKPLVSEFQLFLPILGCVQGRQVLQIANRPARGVCRVEVSGQSVHVGEVVPAGALRLVVGQAEYQVAGPEMDLVDRRKPFARIAAPS